MSNKATLVKAYRRWHDTKGGSVQDWIDLCDDGIRFGSLAEGAAPAAFTAQLVGRSVLKKYFDGLTGQWSMIHFTVDYMIEEGDRVVVVGSTSWKNNATGKILDTPKADIWQFNTSGRAIAFYEYYDTAQLFAATVP